MLRQAAGGGPFTFFVSLPEAALTKDVPAAVLAICPGAFSATTPGGCTLLADAAVPTDGGGPLKGAPMEAMTVAKAAGLLGGTVSEGACITPGGGGLVRTAGGAFTGRGACTAAELLLVAVLSSTGLLLAGASLAAALTDAPSALLASLAAGSLLVSWFGSAPAGGAADDAERSAEE